MAILCGYFSNIMTRIYVSLLFQCWLISNDHESSSARNQTGQVLPNDSHWEIFVELSDIRDSMAAATGKEFLSLLSHNGFPLARQQFQDCAAGRKMQLLKSSSSSNIDFCLVDSHERSIKAICNAYPSPEQIFHWCIQVTSRDSKHGAKHSGLRNILTSAAFVYNLGIMYDAVSELCDLSKHLSKT